MSVRSWQKKYIIGGHQPNENIGAKMGETGRDHVRDADYAERIEKSISVFLVGGKCWVNFQIKPAKGRIMLCICLKLIVVLRSAI